MFSNSYFLQVHSAPVSDIKSHTHSIGDNNIKVTSHVNVGLGDEQNDATGASSPLKNHAIEVSEDDAMHIKIDISINPEMLVGQMESEEIENPGPKKNDQLTDGLAAKMDTLENISKIDEKKEQSISENTDKMQHLDDEADSDELNDETEDESEADHTVPKAVPEAEAKTLEVANKNTEQEEGRSDNKNEAVNPLEKEIAAEEVKEDSHALEAKPPQDSSPAKAVESLGEGHDGDDEEEDDAEDEEDLGDIEDEDENEDNHPEVISIQGAQVPITITEDKVQVGSHAALSLIHI